ncbi:hypothetical protein Sjap_008526 [Stephania japonica]|uniref:Uncharacterized protein n=1 Tax=Stephania japonica TaxID=461633 RepID=A0AAP0PBF6_9MAGN
MAKIVRCEELVHDLVDCSFGDECWLVDDHLSLVCSLLHLHSLVKLLEFITREGKDPKRGAVSVTSEGDDCPTVAAAGPRMSQSKIREERGGQEPPLHGPTPPPAVGRDSLVPGRPAGGPP